MLSLTWCVWAIIQIYMDLFDSRIFVPLQSLIYICRTVPFSASVLFIHRFQPLLHVTIYLGLYKLGKMHVLETKGKRTLSSRCVRDIYFEALLKHQCACYKFLSAWLGAYSKKVFIQRERFSREIQSLKYLQFLFLYFLWFNFIFRCFYYGLLNLIYVTRITFSCGVSLTSWGEGVYLALVGHPPSDGVTIKISYG